MTARYPDLEGLPVLVTGGGSGIGSSIVEHFAAQGARVGSIEVNRETAERTRAAVREATGRDVAFAIADLRDVEATRAAVADLAGRTGAFRVLVNNAGDDARHPWDTVTPELWDERFAVNLRHQFFVAQAVVPGMIAAGGGSIVNLNSISWMFGAAGLVAYTTSKSAVSGLTKSLAREWGVHGIRVNGIAPGWVLTEKQVTRAQAQYPDKFKDYLTRQCLKEHLAPADVARLALWLASEDSRLCTGQTYVVDGGVV
jgi:D-xylose 1-dehydrogenase